MGSFFQKFASVDPAAQAFHLPGSGTYERNQAEAHLSGGGPYAGVAPSLQGAMNGYSPGGAGANSAWVAPTPWHQGGLLGIMQGAAAAPAAATSTAGTPNWGAGPNTSLASPSKTGAVGQVGQDPYAAAAGSWSGGAQSPRPGVAPVRGGF